MKFKLYVLTLFIFFLQVSVKLLAKILSGLLWIINDLWKSPAVIGLILAAGPRTTYIVALRHRLTEMNAEIGLPAELE